MKIQGIITSEIFGKKSKSEHTAIFITTDTDKYRLKMKDGNPFYDEVLHKVIGKNVSLQGELTEHFFIIDTIINEF